MQLSPDCPVLPGKVGYQLGIVLSIDLGSLDVLVLSFSIVRKAIPEGVYCDMVGVDSGTV